MADLQFSVNSQKCISCNQCVKDCPCGVIQNPQGKTPSVTAESSLNCIGCQHCLAVCPTGALSIWGVKPEECHTLDNDLLPTLAQQSLLLRGRRTVRQFDQSNVDKGVIADLLATVSNCPTGCNDRSLKFTVIDEIAVMHQLRERVADLLEQELKAGQLDPASFLAAGLQNYRKHGIDDFFRGAPHALIVSAGPTATCPVEDVNIALSYFELLANTAKLGTLWCGMLKFALETLPELKKALQLDDQQYFYPVLFGTPLVHYHRTVKRDNAAKIRSVKLKELR